MVIYEIHGFGIIGGAGYLGTALSCKEKEMCEAEEALKKIHYAHFGQWKNCRFEYFHTNSHDARKLPKPYVRLECETTKEETRLKAVVKGILETTMLSVAGPFLTKYHPNKHMFRKK